jgi:hypothetical protein
MNIVLIKLSVKIRLDLVCMKEIHDVQVLRNLAQYEVLRGSTDDNIDINRQVMSCRPGFSFESKTL